ncbi:retrotransposon protein, putative, ty1-copia subclass [Tanacetum coccineum]
MTTTVVNNSLFSIVETTKLTGNNLSWDGITILGLPGPRDPKGNPRDIGAYIMLKELKTLYVQQADQELLQTVREFYACKQEEGQFVSSYVHKIKRYIDNLERLGHATTQNLSVNLILVSLRKKYEDGGSEKTRRSNSIGCKGESWERQSKDGLCTYAGATFASNPSRSSNTQKGSQPNESDIVHQCRTTQGPQGSGNEVGALSLYVPAQTWTLLSCGMCRLGHINKKRIEEVCLHDGLLVDSTDSKSLEKCVACMSEFLDHLKEHGIIAQRTPPYTPQNNRVSERRNKTLLDMVRSMMSHTTLPKSFWDYVIESAARILNMVPTKKVEKTPYEVWHGQAPKLSYLKVWGCEALVKRDTMTKRDKLEPKSIKCIFIGYPKETMGYSFYYPRENKIFVARNVEFLENSLIVQEVSGSLEDLEIIQEEDTHPSENTGSHHDEDEQEIDEPQSDIIPIRRSTKTRTALNRMCLHIEEDEYELGDLNEPANYKVALLDPESDKWLNDMNVEMQSMKDNEV